MPFGRKTTIKSVEISNQRSSLGISVFSSKMVQFSSYRRSSDIFIDDQVIFAQNLTEGQICWSYYRRSGELLQGYHGIFWFHQKTWPHRISDDLIIEDQVIAQKRSSDFLLKYQVVLGHLLGRLGHILTENPVIFPWNNELGRSNIDININLIFGVQLIFLQILS